jgi:hypothetical protein
VVYGASHRAGQQGKSGPPHARTLNPKTLNLSGRLIACHTYSSGLDEESG